MKKYLVLALTIGMVACSNDDQPETPPQTNCDCDKVVEVATFNIVGTPQNPAMNYYSVYTTINVCTQIQRQKTFTTTVSSQSPQLGQCR